jgi:hypothetical protein
LFRNKYENELRRKLSEFQSSAAFNSSQIIKNCNVISYLEYESLSIDAHHLSDIIFHIIRESRNSDKLLNKHEKDIVEIRQSIFNQVLAAIQSLKMCLRSIEEKFAVSLLNKSTTDPKFSEIRTSVVEEFLMMLKRAAEAGNDYFDVLKSYEEKTYVAQNVFNILEVAQYFLF